MVAAVTSQAETCVDGGNEEAWHGTIAARPTVAYEMWERICNLGAQLKNPDSGVVNGAGFIMQKKREKGKGRYTESERECFCFSSQPTR